MALRSLSPEVVAEIAEYIPSSKVLLLWLSGDRILMQKLWKIQKIDLKDPIRCSTSRFPRFLPTLRHLRVLNISRPYGPLGWKAFPSELSKMASLTSLSLTTSQKDMEKWFESMNEPFKSIWPNMEVLSLSGANPFDSRWPNASNYPDCLYSLSIAGKHVEEGTTLGMMPRNLKVLCWRSVQPSKPHNAIKLIEPPPGLLFLSLNVRPGHVDQLQCLPKTLLELEFHMDHADFSLPTEHFPINITSLTCSVHGFSPGSVSFSQLVHLKVLKLATVSPQSTGIYLDEQWYPHGLETLAISARLCASRLVLPPRLLELDLSISINNIVCHHDYNSPSPQPGFPPSLKRLRMPNVEIDFEEPHLPSDLEGICLILPPDSAQIGLTSTTEDPRGAMTSRASEKTRLKILRTRKWLPEDNSPPLFWPPITSVLAQLQVSDARQFKEEHFKILPSTLTHLELKQLQPYKDSIYASLPLALSHLELIPIVHVDTLLYPLGIDAWNKLMALRSLVTLRIAFSVLHAVSISDFGRLPDCIRCLDLHGSLGSVTPDCFAYLPRYMTHLYMPLIQGLQDRHFALLPRSIYDLELPVTPQMTENRFNLAPPGVMNLSRRGLMKLTRVIDDPDSNEFGDAIDPRTRTNPYLGEVGRLSLNQIIVSGDVVVLPEQTSGFGSWMRRFFGR